MRHSSPLVSIWLFLSASIAACAPNEDSLVDSSVIAATDSGAQTAPGTSIAAPASSAPSDAATDSSLGREQVASAAAPAIAAGDASADAQAPDASEATAANDGYLGLKQPTSGFRIKTLGTEIPPNSDLEFCEVSEIPGPVGQEYIAGSIDVANGRSSHHLIVAAAAAGSPADKKLRTLEIGARVPCLAATIEFGDGLSTIAASQTSLAKSDYPEGVGIRLRGGQRVVFDYHYFNFGTTNVKTESAIAVHTIPPEQVRNIATVWGFTNMTIDTPPASKGTFTAACRFRHDVMLQGVGRHTHTSGTDFTVWYEGGPKHGQQIWQSLDWEHDITFAFDTPQLVKAGEGFKFACSFKNEKTKPLRFGIRASDEMCILTGSVWSPTPGVEAEIESCLITWVDAQGIGHDARDNGGFPKPSQDEVLSCTLDTFGISLLNECVDCICGSCATPFARCGKDADCKAIFDCRSSCLGEPNCAEKCEPVMFEHSSAVGLATQVGECVATGCGEHCSIGPTSPISMTNR